MSKHKRPAYDDFEKPVSKSSPISSGGLDECLNMIIKNTTLNFIDAAALAKVSIGDKLRLEPHKTLTRINVLNKESEVCGCVASRITQLLGCIDKGNEFVAIVVKKSATSCDVDVHNARL